MELSKAKRQKVQTKMRVVPQKALVIKINYSENVDILNTLSNLMREYRGARELKVVISSKLQEIWLESNIQVSSAIVQEIEKIKEIEIMES